MSGYDIVRRPPTPPVVPTLGAMATAVLSDRRARRVLSEAMADLARRAGRSVGERFTPYTVPGRFMARHLNEGRMRRSLLGKIIYNGWICWTPLWLQQIEASSSCY